MKNVLWDQIKSILDNLSAALKGVTAKVNKVANPNVGADMMYTTDGDGNTKWIKRTHFEGVTEKYFFKDYTVVADVDGAKWGYVGEMAFVPGNEYHVIFEGQEYVCAAYEGGKGNYIGNGLLIKEEFGNGEPFCFDEQEGYVNINTSEGFNEHIISIFEMVEGVKKLDKKFAPDFNLVEGQAEGSLRNAFAAEETDTYKLGEWATALGYNTKASGQGSYAEGRDTESTGIYSHAEGYGTHATDFAAHAEGQSTTASGNYAHAEGTGTTASGAYSHAEGGQTTASENYSHAEGYYSKATKKYSHAEGRNTEANGENAHAEGWYSKANGKTSHAEGDNTIATGANQHAQGKCNVEDASNKYAHIVGNGTSDTARSNAHTLDWDGNAWFKGKVYVGGTSQDDAEELGVGQTDWNAQEGEAGYVKNRTHWSVKTEQDILKDYVMTADDNGEMYISQLFELAGGETYTVTWNGTAYQCTAQKFEENGQSMVMVGNIASVDGSGDTGEPFVLASTDLYAASGVYGMAMPMDGSASATVSIRGNVETVGELDSKYIQTSLYNAVKNCVKPYEPGAIGVGDMVVCEDWFPDGTIAWGRCTAHDVVYKAFPNANTNCVLTFNSSGNFAATGEFFTLNARGYVDGIILRSPDLTRWKIGVSDDGTISATEVS